MDRGVYLIASNVLWYASVASQFTLLAALVRKGLALTYPFFTVFLATSFFFSLYLVALGPHDPSYAIFWSVSVVLSAGLLLGALWEAVHRLLHQCPDRANMSLRRKVALVIAAICLLLVLKEDASHWNFGSLTSATMCLSMAMRRYVCMAGAALLLALWRYLGHDVREFLSRNLRTHLLLLSAYCGTTGLLYWAISLGVSRTIVNMGLAVVPMALYLVWAKVLSSAGEERPASLSGEQAALAKEDSDEFFRSLRMLHFEVRRILRG